MGKWQAALVKTGFVLLAISGIACPKGNPDDDPGTVTDQLYVISCTHDGATQHDPTDAIVATFNRTLSSSTVHTGTVQLWEGVDDVPRTVTTVGDEIHIQPDDPLAYDTWYRLTLDASIQAGSSLLNEDEQFDFLIPQAGAVIPVNMPPFDVLRHGVTMYSVWGSDEGTIAVGHDGLVLVGTPAGRFVVRVPDVQAGATNVELRDVSVAPSGEIYVVGSYKGTLDEDGLAFRVAVGNVAFDGGGPDPWTGVHAVSGDEAFAAAGLTVWARRDLPPGSGWAWDPILTSTGGVGDYVVRRVWAPSTQNVFGAAAQGLLLGTEDALTREFDWRVPYPTPVGVDCWAVSGRISGPSQFHAVAVAGDTTIWWLGLSNVEKPRPGYLWRDVCWASDNWAVQVGEDATDLGYSVLFYDPNSDRDGTDKAIETPERLEGVAAWAVGIDRFARAVGEAGATFTFEDLDTTPNDGVWSRDPIGKRDTQGGIADWTDLARSPVATDDLLYGIRDGVLVERLVGDTEWSFAAAAGNLTLLQAYCLGDDDVFATGIDPGQTDRFLAHYDGTAWTMQWFSSIDTPRDLWAADGQNVFVACDHGVVYLLGGIWTPMGFDPPAANHLYGVWGTAADSVWVCGEDGLVGHYDGTGSFTRSPAVAFTTEHLRAIHGTSETNIVVAGDAGTVFRYDGGQWIDLDPGSDVDIVGVDLTMVWTEDADEIWAASPDGVVLHYNGISWTKLTTGIPNARLNVMFGGPIFPADMELWIAGDDDLLLRHAFPPVEIPFGGGP